MKNEWQDLNEQDDKQRRRSLRQSIKDILNVITNADGLRRLRAITDDEWQAADTAGDEGAELAADSPVAQ
jgi:hypothetical protein